MNETVTQQSSTEIETTAGGSTALDPYAAAANEMGNNFLPIVKMTKAGQWVSGPDEEALEDHEAAFAMHTFAHGFVCWKDGDVVDEKMVLVASGELRPLIDELPDHGPYENDNDGWVGTASIQLRLLKTDEEFLYRPSSRGGLNALAGLARKYANKRQSQPGVVPIVRLESKSYAHRQFGEIFNPVLRVLDWKDEPELVVAVAAIPVRGDNGGAVPGLDGDIPY